MLQLETETVLAIAGVGVIVLALVIYMTWFIATQHAMLASKRRLDFAYRLIGEYQKMRGTSHLIRVVDTHNLDAEIPDLVSRARVYSIMGEDHQRFGCYRVGTTYVVHDITHNQRVTFIFKDDVPDYQSLLVSPRKHPNGIPSEHQLAALRERVDLLTAEDGVREQNTEATVA